MSKETIEPGLMTEVLSGWYAGPKPEPPAPHEKAFEIALKRFRLNRPMEIRAYLGLIPRLDFRQCAACDKIDFLQPSGLSGWTCGACEDDIAHHLMVKD